MIESCIYTQNIIIELNEEKYHSKTLEAVLETAYDWIVLVDKEGIITMMSRTYLDFLGFSKEEAIGTHVSKIIPNSRMHIVAKTGKAEIGDIQEIKGNHMIATRLPIIVDGEIIGAVGKVNFKDISDFNIMAKKVSNMENELEFYKKELKKVLGAEYTFDSIIGVSESISNIKKLASKVARSKSNILILGDSGTGKELFAHAIHNASPRAEYPLIKINCAAIPHDLLESELFGYDGGAFTGAKKEGKPGKFELAHKSTIFLDEIGDMPLSLQAKLLRVVQEREIERVGSVQSQKIDVRIIAATNKNLEEMVKQKEFREDLYYRLNVINIKIPPLRDRKDDIPITAKYLLKKLSKDMGMIITEISSESMQAIVSYNWPGNIRELENVLERALNIIDKDSVIRLEHLPYYILKNNSVVYQEKDHNLKLLVEHLEKNVIIECLARTGQNKYETSKKLGISRTSLYQKIQKYEL